MLLISGRTLRDLVEQLIEEGDLELETALFGGENRLFLLLEARSDEALGAGQRLFADVVFRTRLRLDRDLDVLLRTLGYTRLSET